MGPVVRFRDVGDPAPTMKRDPLPVVPWLALLACACVNLTVPPELAAPRDLGGPRTRADGGPTVATDPETPDAATTDPDPNPDPTDDAGAPIVAEDGPSSPDDVGSGGLDPGATVDPVPTPGADPPDAQPVAGNPSPDAAAAPPAQPPVPPETPPAPPPVPPAQPPVPPTPPPMPPAPPSLPPAPPPAPPPIPPVPPPAPPPVPPAPPPAPPPIPPVPPPPTIPPPPPPVPPPPPDAAPPPPDAAPDSGPAPLLIDDFDRETISFGSPNPLGGIVDFDNQNVSIVGGELRFVYSGSGGFQDFIETLSDSFCPLDVRAYRTLRFRMRASSGGKRVVILAKTSAPDCDTIATPVLTTITVGTTMTTFQVNLSSLDRDSASAFEWSPPADSTVYFLDDVELVP